MKYIDMLILLPLRRHAETVRVCQRRYLSNGSIDQAQPPKLGGYNNIQGLRKIAWRGRLQVGLQLCQRGGSGSQAYRIRSSRFMNRGSAMKFLASIFCIKLLIAIAFLILIGISIAHADQDLADQHNRVVGCMDNIGRTNKL
jgi:hypothetical protein